MATNRGALRRIFHRILYLLSCDYLSILYQFYLSIHPSISPLSAKMAAVITLQSSSAAGPAAPSFQQQQQPQPHSPDSQPSHRRRLSRAQHQHDGPPSTPLSPVSSTLTASAARAPGRDGPSCDACLRRKSRCAMNEMVNKCYSCDFHRQECTFNLSSGASRPNTAQPLSKKRKLEDSVPEDAESVKRYVHRSRMHQSYVLLC